MSVPEHRAVVGRADAINRRDSRTEAEANVADTRPEELSVLITARTDDGRRVTFRHDEIRDYKDNIRLDYGYALTIASAQGLTVDRAFLLADARPARETIYPAATRHREALGHLRQPRRRWYSTSPRGGRRTRRTRRSWTPT